MSIVLLVPFSLRVYRWFPVDAWLWLFLMGALASFALLHLLSYFMLYFRVEERRKKVEYILPDFLQLVSSNLRSGMTPYRALREASRPEFGILSEEIQLATAKSLGSEDFSQSLMQVAVQIRSDTVERTLTLFTTALRSGASLATVLDEIALDLSENRALKSELISSTKSYTAFILFTLIFGSPLLLAISMHFIAMVTHLQETNSIQGTGTAVGVSLFSGEPVITISFLLGVSITMLLVTSILAGILIGVIKEGSEKYGLRYAPSLITASLLMFFLFRFLVSSMFG